MNNPSQPGSSRVVARSWMLGLAVLVLLAGGGVARAENVIETINLPEGVSISMPRNWIILSDNQRITVQAFLEAATHSPERTSEYPFAANFYNDRGRTIALLNVRYYPKAEVSQENARNGTAEEIREIDEILKANTTKGIVAAGYSVVSWGGTRKVEINGITALISEYRRGDPDGPFRVRLVRVFAGPRSFTLTVSYLESAAAVLEPITDRIVESLRLTGFPQPVATVAPRGVDQRPSAADAQLLGYLNPTQRLLLVWIIGLVPPLLVRYVLFRRRLGRVAAVLVTVILFFFALVLLTAFGFSTNPVAFITFVSFWILTRDTKPSVSGVDGVDSLGPATKDARDPASESSTRYFVRTSTDTAGPYRISELRQMLESGSVFPETECRAVGDEVWVTVAVATAR